MCIQAEDQLHNSDWFWNELLNHLKKLYPSLHVEYIPFLPQPGENWLKQTKKSCNWGQLSRYFLQLLSRAKKFSYTWSCRTLWSCDQRHDNIEKKERSWTATQWHPLFSLRSLQRYKAARTKPAVLERCNSLLHILSTLCLILAEHSLEVSASAGCRAATTEFLTFSFMLLLIVMPMS